MIRLSLPRFSSRAYLQSSHRLNPLRRRLLSSQAEANRSRSRANRIISRLPKFLQKYTAPLINAPLTHVTSFLLLHELTAVVPLLALAGIFHYTQWLPPFISEGKWVADGVEKFGRWFRKKGWLGDEEKARRTRWWGKGEGGVRLVVELATAYAITKALLPLRLVFSVSATPWFARIAVVPLTSAMKRVFTRGGKRGGSSGSGGAGTGAVGAGAIPKSDSAAASPTAGGKASETPR
ncbi:MAG: hypothetical protein M1812_001381 [Candelaria pacifica]|nr:MAG: hypothetical protein M1812_001381 [Candelaria pacifica]